MLSRRASLLLLTLFALTPPAHATIYKYVDAEGNITFTDRYRPGAVKLVDSPSEPSRTSTVPSKRRATTNPTPASFPRVDKQTQSKRDNVRRTLLMEERANEENSLAAARAALAGGKQRAPAEQAKLSENLRLHEKNIEMLDKELARIK